MMMVGRSVNMTVTEMGTVTETRIETEMGMATETRMHGGDEDRD